MECEGEKKGGYRHVHDGPILFPHNAVNRRGMWEQVWPAIIIRQNFMDTERGSRKYKTSLYKGHTLRINFYGKRVRRFQSPDWAGQDKNT
jgi:hypothetical protein